MEEFSLTKVAEFRISDYPERLAEAQLYIKKYFVPLNTGNQAVFINGKFEIIETKVVKSTYFNRMPEELSKWYFKKYLELRKITYELNKPLMFDNKLNLCPPMKWKYKNYETFNNKTKECVDVILNYILEVLANKSEEIYNYLLKWLSNMIKGNKNDSCLYLRGSQGIGKSTLFLFIRDFVIGNDLCLETGSSPIKSNFNGILAGKLLVILEELETFSTNEWIAVSSRLKRYITSNTITIENKNVNSFPAENLNNYVILSNNDAIKDDDGRRYFILDISNHRQGDKIFWSDIYNKCFNNEVGEAFYCKLMEINTVGFYPQHMPLTESKKDAFVKRLETHELFLKSNFVLQKRNIECGVQELYEEYKNFCKTSSFKVLGKIVFGRKLEELNIKYYKTNGVNKYKIPYEKLKSIADGNKWIHEIDDDIINNSTDEELEEELKIEICEKDIEINKLKEEILLLKENKSNASLKPVSQATKAGEPLGLWTPCEKATKKGTGLTNDELGVILNNI